MFSLPSSASSEAKLVLKLLENFYNLLLMKTLVWHQALLFEINILKNNLLNKKKFKINLKPSYNKNAKIQVTQSTL